MNVVASQIATMNHHSSPTFDDYVAALSVQCMWPPNKPPLVEQYWPQIYPAFYNEATRNKLRQAVGPQAGAVSYAISKYGIDGFSSHSANIFRPIKSNIFRKYIRPDEAKMINCLIRTPIIDLALAFVGDFCLDAMAKDADPSKY